MAIPSWLSDLLLQQALELASLAHAAHETASAAVTQAVLWLDTATDRSEETLEDRLKKGRRPTRLVLLGPPLFQQLVYLASDQLAKKEGRAEECFQSEERMLARYLQFLLSKVLKRSSRWTALGMAQLVYGYRGPDTDRIIERLTDNEWSEERKRSKRILMDLLAGRFSGLRIVEARHGQSRHFEPCADRRRFEPLVWNWLDAMTPWSSEHRANRRSHGSEALAADWAELDRCHAVIHPECFALLLAELDLPPGTQKLRLPRLVRCDDGDTPDSVGRAPVPSPPQRGTKDGSAIRNQIEQQADRRNRLSGDEFEIRIDGRFAAALLTSNAAVRFSLPVDADIIELYGRDREGEVLVATHILDHSEDGEAVTANSVVAVGDRHVFRFEIEAAPSAAGAGPALFCSVRHTQGLVSSGARHRARVLWAAAAVFALLLIGSTIGFVSNRRLRTELVQLQADQATRQARQQELERQVAELQAAARESRAKIAPPVSAPSQPLPSTNVVATTLLMPIGVRGNQAPQPPVVIPPDARTLTVTLALETVVTDGRYAATIETTGGRVLQRLNGLSAIAMPDGQHAVTLRMTASGMSSDDYIIRLHARLTANAREAPVGEYHLRIAVTQ